VKCISMNDSFLTHDNFWLEMTDLLKYE